jgi:uncharacterized protein YjbJ (UPF0337 family)
MRTGLLDGKTRAHDRRIPNMRPGSLDKQRKTKAKEETMNWDQVGGKWKQLSGKAKEKWGKLTDDDLTVAAGRKDQLVGKIQERYGTGKEQAEREVDDWVRGL